MNQTVEMGFVEALPALDQMLESSNITENLWTIHQDVITQSPILQRIENGSYTPILKSYFKNQTNKFYGGKQK